MSLKKEYLSFKDFVPEIKLTRKNRRPINVTEYVKRRLQKYKETNSLVSDSHAVHSLIVENEMLISIMQKLDTAIKTATKREDPEYFIAVFHSEASPQEKAMFDLIWRGALI